MLFVYCQLGEDSILTSLWNDNRAFITVRQLVALLHVVLNRRNKSMVSPSTQIWLVGVSEGKNERQ